MRCEGLGQLQSQAGHLRRNTIFSVSLYDRGLMLLLFISRSTNAASKRQTQLEAESLGLAAGFIGPIHESPHSHQSIIPFQSYFLRQSCSAQTLKHKKRHCSFWFDLRPEGSAWRVERLECSAQSCPRIIPRACINLWCMTVMVPVVQQNPHFLACGLVSSMVIPCPNFERIARRAA